VHPAVTNVGQRPTFGDQLATTVETYILNRPGDWNLYGRTVRLAFVQRLRDERKFPDLEALQEQIAADVRRASRLFDRLSV
jgi:riboflavin kinase/FMN adenylyltransferase